MFCPFCGRQNKEDTVFCEYCGKALPQKNFPLPETRSIPQANPPFQKADKPRFRLSYNAKRAIVTSTLVVGLVIVVLLIYYPSIFPWNW
jgi:uncharacterized membrane protein YvbJ